MRHGVLLPPRTRPRKTPKEVECRQQARRQHRRPRALWLPRDAALTRARVVGGGATGRLPPLCGLKWRNAVPGGESPNPPQSATGRLPTGGCADLKSAGSRRSTSFTEVFNITTVVLPIAKLMTGCSSAKPGFRRTTSPSPRRRRHWEEKRLAPDGQTRRGELLHTAGDVAAKARPPMRAYLPRRLGDQLQSRECQAKMLGVVQPVDSWLSSNQFSARTSLLGNAPCRSHGAQLHSPLQRWKSAIVCCSSTCDEPAGQSPDWDIGVQTGYLRAGQCCDAGKDRRCR